MNGAPTARWLGLLFFSMLLIPSAFAQEQKYDFLIRGALVFDGESVKGVQADLGIRGDRIAAIGNLAGAAAKKTIEAKGLVLAPGFIDAHTHSDFNPLIYPKLSNKILQGVTGEVIGNCGMSAAPVTGLHRAKIREIWAREGVKIPAVSWESFKEYRKALLSEGLRTNLMGLVGHGNLRSAVLGVSPRKATKGEIAQMKTMLSRAMSEGAGGVSFGLIYLPGIFAGKEELVELCREAGRRGGVCAFHMRSEGSRLIESIEEVISIGREAGAPVQISHLKAGGKNNWPKIDEAFRRIEKARRQGLRVTADAYPYTATAVELGVMLPDEIYQREDRVVFFKDPTQRTALIEKLKHYYKKRGMNWGTVMIASVENKKYQKYEGMTILEISRETGKEPEAFLVEILAGTRFEVSSFGFSQSQEGVDRVMTRPYVGVGSDSIADGSRKPHPRAFGTFPKIFSRYFRTQKTLKLGEAIRKMTSLVADQFGIEGRGRIRSGDFADLVLFDAGEIRDLSTYERPALLPRGIQWVFVNGRPAVKNGKPTGERAGRFLSPHVKL